MIIIPDEVSIQNLYKRNIYTNTHLHLSGKEVLRRSRELTWKCYSYPAKIYLFKVNNRNTIDVGDVVLVFYYKLWTYFTLFSSVSIFVFEQVNVSGALDIKGYFKALSNIFHPHMIGNIWTLTEIIFYGFNWNRGSFRCCFFLFSTKCWKIFTVDQVVKTCGSFCVFKSSNSLELGRTCTINRVNYSFTWSLELIYCRKMFFSF